MNAHSLLRVLAAPGLVLVAALPSRDAMRAKQTRRSTLLIWLRRLGLGFAAVVIALASLGAAYQGITSASDQRDFPPPGQLVDVGGYRLHFYCTGESAPGAPTVILETMSGGSLVNWAWVQPEVAKVARVCSYDPAGYGWSDPNPRVFGLQEAVTDLHNLLSRAGIDGPYVLVGHSKGGVVVRQFAADHPNEVVGMVLVDAAHPDQFARHPEYLQESEELMPLIQAAPLLARFGLMRLYVAGGGFEFGDLPAQQRAELAAAWSSPKHWDSERRSLSTSASFYVQAQDLGDVDDMPLAVVTAGDNPLAGWTELQAELAALSSNSVHEIVAGATHVSLAFSPQHAAVTSKAILEVLAAARTGNDLGEEDG